MNLHQEFNQICRKNAWKLTPQRLRVYQVIHGNLTHPSVDQVLEAVRAELPSVTRESVYRILNEFAAGGVTMRLDDLNAARYDWQTKPHGHFICKTCGGITDFPLPENLPIPSEWNHAALSHVELRLVGECSTCSDAALKTSNLLKNNPR